MDIKTEQDGHPDVPWTAIIETKNLGTFYGYGRTEQEAITDVKNEYNFLTDERDS